MSELRVVVADDDVVMRELIAALVDDHPSLQLSGEAASGAAAMRLISLVRPDVLICDYELGDMAADALVEHVRAFSAVTRIVLHSGRADVHDLGRTMRVDHSARKGAESGMLPHTLHSFGWEPHDCREAGRSGR